MAKRPRNYIAYMAPGITGQILQNGNLYFFDEREGRKLNPNNIEDKIHIYERQVKGWFLDIAKKLSSNDINGFIVLMITLSYIEGVEQFLDGQSSRDNSKRFFKKGLRRILGPQTISDYQAREIYEQARCGLFHNGMTERKIIIRDVFPEIIEFFGDDEIRINHKKLLEKIIQDFENYIKKLKDPRETDCREKFDRMFTMNP